MTCGFLCGESLRAGRCVGVIKPLLFCCCFTFNSFLGSSDSDHVLIWLKAIKWIFAEFKQCYLSVFIQAEVKPSIDSCLFKYWYEESNGLLPVTARRKFKLLWPSHALIYWLLVRVKGRGSVGFNAPFEINVGDKLLVWRSGQWKAYSEGVLHVFAVNSKLALNEVFSPIVARLTSPV